MRVCFTSEGNTIDAKLDDHFGRCAYFIVVDTDNDKSEFHVNDGLKSEHGAGISAAQQVQDLKVDALVTGRLGPNAKKIIQETDIKVYKIEAASVKENIEMLNKGQLSSLS